MGRYRVLKSKKTPEFGACHLREAKDSVSRAGAGECDFGDGTRMSKGPGATKHKLCEKYRMAKGPTGHVQSAVRGGLGPDPDRA